MAVFFGGGRRKRCVRFFVVLAVLALVLGQNSFVTNAQSGRGSSDPLDLPWMAITASDLGDAGLDGFVHVGSQLLGAEDYMNRHIESRPEVEDEMTELLGQGGAVNRYDIFLDRFNDEGNHIQRVRSYLLQFGDDDAAEEWFDYYEDESDIPGNEDLDDAEEIGDISEVTRSDVDPEETEAEVPGVQYDYTTVVENVYAGVQLTQFALPGERFADDPDMDVLVEIMERFVEKIEVGIAGDTPGLGIATLHFANGGLWLGVSEVQELATRSDTYKMADGAYLPNPDDSPDDRLDELESMGVVAEYQHNATLGVEGRDLPAVEVALDEFESRADASDYLEELGDGIGEENADGLADFDELGDGMLFFSYDLDDVSGYAVVVQSGKIVFRVTLDASVPFDPEVVYAIAEAQVDCLDQGFCDEYYDFPEDEFES